MVPAIDGLRMAETLGT